jgi:ankyrin repeat protein
MGASKTQLYFDLVPIEIIKIFALSLHPEQLKLISQSQDPRFNGLKKVICTDSFGHSLLDLHFPINHPEVEDFHRLYHGTSNRPKYNALQIFWVVYDHQYEAFNEHFKNLFYLVKTNNLETLKLLRPSFNELLEIKKIYESYPSYHHATESRESNIVFAAARAKHQDILDYFYHLGMNWDRTKYLHQPRLQTLVGSPLHLATICNQELACTSLLDGGTDLTAINEEGCTPLHLAVQYGHLNLVTLFLTRTANVNALNKDNESPLHLAAHYGHTEIAAALIGAGADKNALDSWGNSPVFIATLRGHSGIVQLLHGARIVAIERHNKSPVIIAARSGHILALGLFSRRHLVTDHVLGEAVRFGQEEVVRFMLGRKANPNYKVTIVHKDMGFSGSEVMPVLELAARYNHTNIVRLLLAAEASLAVKGYEGVSWANVAGTRQEILSMLQDAEQKQTKAKHLAKLETLVKGAADYDSEKKQGIIVLHYSVNAGFESPRLIHYRKLLAKDPELKEILDYWFPVGLFASIGNCFSWFSEARENNQPAPLLDNDFVIVETEQKESQHI